MTLTPGTKLGPYEILSPIGSGGRGECGKRGTQAWATSAIRTGGMRIAVDMTKNPEVRVDFDI